MRLKKDEKKINEEVLEEVEEVVEDCIDPTADELQDAIDTSEKLKAQLARAMADYSNLKNRTERERADIIRSANSALMQKMLPVLDSFEAALSDEVTAELIGPIAKQFLEILIDEGLERVKSLGEEFDPNYHEAVMMGPGEEDNIILQVFEQGYIFKDKLIRTAKVQVSNREEQ